MPIAPIGDAELIALLDDLESDRAERKRAWSGDVPERVREAVCAFANDLPNHGRPGVVIIGAKDDGAPAALDVSDQLLTTLADIKTDGNIVPPPTIIVQRRRVKDADLAVLTVFPADAPPVRFKGRIWVRIGPRRAIADAQDERILSEKRRHRDRAFDTQPITPCPIGELNQAVFENEYLPQAIAADVLAANDRSYIQRLASTCMIASMDDPTPTVVGVLAIGKSPRSWVPCSYVQFLRVRGTQWGDPVVDEQDLDGTLDLILRRLEEKLRAHVSVAVDFTSGTLTEQRSVDYPLSALQQLTRNAVMHRSYEGTNAPVRVYWFDDRIEITNPGGAFGQVTAANFGQLGVSDYRNPQIATVLKTLGFVQRFGFGIAEARRALAANGNPPLEFQVEPTHVLATVRRTP